MYDHSFLYHELATRAGARLAGGREFIRAVAPSRAEQRLLGLSRSVGALAIDRLGVRGDRPVEWERTLFRGDRFSLIAEFSQRTGYPLHLDNRYPDFRRASWRPSWWPPGQVGKTIRDAPAPSDVKGAVPHPRRRGTAPLAPLSGMPAAAPRWDPRT
jgi:hypothetical protein